MGTTGNIMGSIMASTMGTKISIGIIIVLLVTAAVIVIASEDSTAPVITFNIPAGKEITYTSGEEKEKLIQYASAVDNKDGDVSDSIKIEDIFVSSDFSTINVLFVARDKSNNIAKGSRVFKYIASREEIANQTKINQNATSETAANVSATIATSTKPKEPTSATTVASEKPVLSLTQSEATITQGDKFNVIQYVKDITDDKDTRNILFTRIIVSGYDASKADTSKAGDFPMSIYCTDTEGNLSNTEKFILHIKAKKVEEPTITEIKPDTTPVITPDTTPITDTTPIDTTPVTTPVTTPDTIPPAV